MKERSILILRSKNLIIMRSKFIIMMRLGHFRSTTNDPKSLGDRELVRDLGSL